MGITRRQLQMTNYIHPLADVQTTNIGEDTGIWQFCVVMKNAKIGTNSNICAQVLIDNDLITGKNVTIKSGMQFWDRVPIENNIFTGSNAKFTNDLFPPHIIYPVQLLPNAIKIDAPIAGHNQTIMEDKLRMQALPRKMKNRHQLPQHAAR